MGWQCAPWRAPSRPQRVKAFAKCVTITHTMVHRTSMGRSPVQSLPARGTLLAARPTIGGCIHSPHAGRPAANKRASRQGLGLAPHAIGGCHFHLPTVAAAARGTAVRSGFTRQGAENQPPGTCHGCKRRDAKRRRRRAPRGAPWSGPVTSAPYGPSRLSEVSGGTHVHRSACASLRMTRVGAVST